MDVRISGSRQRWWEPPRDGLASWLVADLAIHAIGTAILVTLLGLMAARPRDVPLGLTIFVPAALVGRTVGVAGQLAWRRLKTT